MSTFGLLLSIGALLSWGITMFLRKIMVDTLGWWYSTVIVAAAALLPLVFIQPFIKTPFRWDTNAVVISIVAGIFGVAGGICYHLAIRNDSPSLIAMISSLYPVITIVLSVFILGDKLTAVQIVGIALMMVGLVLVSAPI